ncbi:hypothetical protein AAE478_006581 [Parahypoxylon ruwenzoriense]
MPSLVISRFDEMGETPGKPQKRQRPGNACEACRRRKLRCDRGQPQCSSCRASGSVCQVQTTRRPGGPKRGYLKTLQARISALEGSVLEQQQQQQFQTMVLSPALTSPEMVVTDQLQLSWDFGENSLEDPGPVLDQPVASPVDSGSTGTTPDDLKIGFPETAQLIQTPVPIAAEKIPIPSLMQADLDQLYFDRIHDFIPILHRRRCLSWRRRPDQSPAHAALQYAIWTLAASGSAHYHGFRDMLSRQARQFLERLGSDPDSESAASTELEQVQAWLLLAVHEFMCVGFRRGCITAGRAFALIQLNSRQWLRDDPEADCVDSEQKRRAFWMAFCLDRFISLRNSSMPTFGEQMAMRVSLPASEADSQNGQPGFTRFLSEAIVPALADYGTGQITAPAFSPFVECIVVATVAGRVLLHQHQASIDEICLHEGSRSDFWDRHAGLDALLTHRIDIFSRHYPLRIDDGDIGSDEVCPMSLFVFAMWRTIVICLHQSIKDVLPPLDEKRASTIDYYTGRLRLATQNMVRLSSKVAELNRWKVTLQTPIP